MTSLIQSISVVQACVVTHDVFTEQVTCTYSKCTIVTCVVFHVQVVRNVSCIVVFSNITEVVWVTVFDIQVVIFSCV